MTTANPKPAPYVNRMKNILTNLRAPAIISFLIVLPFMILELANRRNFNRFVVQ